jgi:hypothetical protein
MDMIQQRMELISLYAIMIVRYVKCNRVKLIIFFFVVLSRIFGNLCIISVQVHRRTSIIKRYLFYVYTLTHYERCCMSHQEVRRTTVNHTISFIQDDDTIR